MLDPAIIRLQVVDAVDVPSPRVVVFKGGVKVPVVADGELLFDVSGIDEGVNLRLAFAVVNVKHCVKDEEILNVVNVSAK